MNKIFNRKRNKSELKIFGKKVLIVSDFFYKKNNIFLKTRTTYKF
jgi:hypothetical protein